jgi:hypothetical protein
VKAERAKELLPIIQAFAEGKAIQYQREDQWKDAAYPNFDVIDARWRIKPSVVHYYRWKTTIGYTIAACDKTVAGPNWPVGDTWTLDWASVTCPECLARKPKDTPVHIPDTASSDATVPPEKPLPIQPPDGYRLLYPHETLVNSDMGRINGLWVPIPVDIPKQVSQAVGGTFDAFARKLEVEKEPVCPNPSPSPFSEINDLLEKCDMPERLVLVVKLTMDEFNAFKMAAKERLELRAKLAASENLNAVLYGKLKMALNAEWGELCNHLEAK